VVRLFDHGGLVGHALLLGSIGLPQIVEAHETIVTSSYKRVGTLGVEPQAAQGGGGEELSVGGVGVHNVPDVTAHGHLSIIHEPLVLEVEDGVSHGNLSVGGGSLRVPVDAGGGPLDIVGVPEDGEAAEGDKRSGLRTCGVRKKMGWNENFR
jgi:hypothetical protein